MKWQPIDTCERSETTPILVYCGPRSLSPGVTTNGSGRMAIVRWTGWGGGSWQCAQTGHSNLIEPYEVTHWRPLPKPPELDETIR